MSIKDEWHYRHLSANTLVNKDSILSVSENIDDSFSGRVDIMGLHRFFMEAACMIRNAVSQYEQGFIDAAFYSVRSALELARIIAYFSNQNQPLESDIYKKWVQGGKFPYDSKVRTLLADISSVYSEVREALSDFFNEQDERLKQANKYIHKQGYKTFYMQDGLRPDLKEFRKHTTNKLFSDFITNSTIEIAFLRLCIDPFPILLQDEAVMYKIHFQSMTFPFSSNTIDFIGQDNIEKYRSTEFYKSHVENYANNEDLCEEAYSVINDEYYDRQAWCKIKSQLGLLSVNDQIAVLVFNVSKVISDIYFYSGFAHYFSNVHSSNGTMRGFDSQDLDKVRKSEIKANTQYYKSYMSYFSYGDNECWVEHNRRLTVKQIGQINRVVEDVIRRNMLTFSS